ncbi:MAG: hypothetical protein IJ039_09400 [Clostridia bacterium]|nr:hypothetical protein [Clostridia bacterium]
MKECILTSTIYHLDKDITFYGIAVVDKGQGVYELISKHNDLSKNKKEVQALVDYYNSLGADCKHLETDIEDLLSK